MIKIAERLGKDRLDALPATRSASGSRPALDFPGESAGSSLDADEVHRHEHGLDPDRLRHRGHADADARRVHARSPTAAWPARRGSSPATIDADGKRHDAPLRRAAPGGVAGHGRRGDRHAARWCRPAAPAPRPRSRATRWPARPAPRGSRRTTPASTWRPSSGSRRPRRPRLAAIVVIDEPAGQHLRRRRRGAGVPADHAVRARLRAGAAPPPDRRRTRRCPRPAAEPDRATGTLTVDPVTEPRGRARVRWHDLLAGLDGPGELDELGGLELTGDPDVEVADITHDSRRVEPGCAVLLHPAARSPTATTTRPRRVGAGRGRAARRAPAPARRCPRSGCRACAPRSGPLAARCYGEPSRAMRVLGVTGTNGKTTTTYLLEAIAPGGRRARRA